MANIKFINVPFIAAEKHYNNSEVIIHEYSRNEK